MMDCPGDRTPLLLKRLNHATCSAFIAMKVSADRTADRKISFHTMQRSGKGASVPSTRSNRPVGYARPPLVPASVFYPSPASMKFRATRSLRERFLSPFWPAGTLFRGLCAHKNNLLKHGLRIGYP